MYFKVLVLAVVAAVVFCKPHKNHETPPVVVGDTLCGFCHDQIEQSIDRIRAANITVLQVPLIKLKQAATRMCKKNMRRRSQVPVCTYITFQMGKYLIGKDINDIEPKSACLDLNLCMDEEML
ncbi:unnamed protein product, partial [Mesorhabditis spiculigera]